MTITDWIQAISMVVLVAVTIFYAWQTKKTVSEMREQRYDTVRPVIDIQHAEDGNRKLGELAATQEEIVSRGLTCILHNNALNRFVMKALKFYLVSC